MVSRSERAWGYGVVGMAAALAVACGGAGAADGTAAGGNAFSGPSASPKGSASASAAAPAPAAPSFEGQWTATFSAPGASDTAIVITYVITVHGGDVLFSADGFQTSDRMNAKGKVSGNDLVVTFDSCGADDQFQCSNETAGEALFHLHHDGQKYLLVWDKFEGEGKNLPLELDKSPWSGTWEADFTAPGAEGTAIAITYVATVDGENVSFNADGFQTDVRINGKATLQGNDLSVVFDSCGPDDQFQCANETKGDVLFHLHLDGQKRTLVWDKFEGEGKDLPVDLHQ